MLQGKAVLIIDDDNTLLTMYGEQLKFDGMIVEYAHDGEEALRVADENIPNVIILDLMMPKINGIEVLRSLKANDRTKGIPVVILSALMDSEKKKAALELGAAAYFVKSEVLPIDIVNKLTELLK